MRKIIYITGGQRSGKSRYAQKLALQLSDHPIYLATSRIWDDNYRERIRKHQADRGPEWINLEEEKALSKHSVTGQTVLIDCATLWATNFFFDNDSDIEKSIKEIICEFEKFIAAEATFIFVSNEIGMGGVSNNTTQCKFTDLLGMVNQHIANKADEVYLMISGIATKIK